MTYKCNNIMKTHKLLMLTLPAFLLGACSSDDNNAPSADANAIRFTAVADAPTRQTTTSNLQNFTVYAFTDKTPFMKNVRVYRQSGTWTYTPTMYWPVNPVNFYAYSPDISEDVEYDPANGRTIPNHLVDYREDLIYSVAMDQTAKPTPVMMNFRHATSKVSVLLSSNNKRIRVDVSYVTLQNLNLRGTFEFPDQTTSADSDVAGRWYDQHYPATVLLYNGRDLDADNNTLTATPTDLSVGNLEARFFLPQSLTVPALTGETLTGNYIEVCCSIYDADSGVKLWPNNSTPEWQKVDNTLNDGRLVYTLANDHVKEWKPGNAYVYNIVIDNPDVLDKIDFDVTVDDYTNF